MPRIGDKVTFLKFPRAGIRYAQTIILGEGYNDNPMGYAQGRIMSIRPNTHEIDVIDFRGHVWRMELDWWRIKNAFGKDLYAESLRQTHE